MPLTSKLLKDVDYFHQEDIFISPTTKIIVKTLQVIKDAPTALLVWCCRPFPDRSRRKGSGDMAIPKLFWWNVEVASIIS